MYVHWDAWNLNHLVKHNVGPSEAEHVFSQARPPYPEETGDGKYTVWDRTVIGRYLQVIFIQRPVEQIRLQDIPPYEREEVMNLSAVPYIIHARDLTPAEKTRFRKRTS